MTRELPILFNGEMVRALLDGRKTQTRRPVKPQPDTFYGRPLPVSASMRVRSDGFWVYCVTDADGGGRESGPVGKCPLGAPGDLLYVRETWAPCDYHADGVVRDEPTCVRYRADDAAYRHEGDAVRLDTTGWGPCGGWRPSIHMPKWAARIWLRVTDARVERIDSISMADVNAEGFEACEEFEGCFRQTWDAIYGPQGFGWDANPWVWAVTFERVEAPR